MMSPSKCSTCQRDVDVVNQIVPSAPRITLLAKVIGSPSTVPASTVTIPSGPIRSRPRRSSQTSTPPSGSGSTPSGPSPGVPDERPSSPGRVEAHDAAVREPGDDEAVGIDPHVLRAVPTRRQPAGDRELRRARRAPGVGRRGGRGPAAGRDQSSGHPDILSPRRRRRNTAVQTVARGDVDDDRRAAAVRRRPGRYRRRAGARDGRPRTRCSGCPPRTTGRCGCAASARSTAAARAWAPTGRSCSSRVSRRRRRCSRSHATSAGPAALGRAGARDAARPAQPAVRGRVRRLVRRRHRAGRR